MTLFWTFLTAIAAADSHVLQVETQRMFWAGGEIVHAKGFVNGIPIDAPALVSTYDLSGRTVGHPRPWPDLEGLNLVPAISEEKAAEAIALGWGVQPSRRGTLVVFPDEGRARLAWRFSVSAMGGRWSVWVDASTAEVFDAEASSWSASAKVYDPNPLESDLKTVTLSGLTDPVNLKGKFAFATTCVDWFIDPKPFGERVCLEWSAESKSTVLGDHFYSPAEGEANDPFTEAQVYFHVDKISRWAATEFGLRLGYPIQIFTNFPMTNAFFGDFDDDGTRDLSFGISDDGFNLGYDSDVVYHEFGHALVRRLAGSMWMQADSLGLDWTPGALNEGVADTFAMILNPDPLLAESMSRSSHWEKGIRDFSEAKMCPDDLQSQVHRSGTVWGATTWRMIDDERIGPQLMGQLLVAAVASWSNSTDWPDAGASIIAAASQLADQAIIDSETMLAVSTHIEASGMLDCERIVDLSISPAMTLSLLNYGLHGEYERVPAGVQFRYPIGNGVDHVRLKVSNFSGPENGTGLAVYISVGQPVAHDTTRVEGLGLHHAIPVEYDAVFEIDTTTAELEISAQSVPGFQPGVEVYGSVGSINRSRAPMDVAYSSVVLSADALLLSGAIPLGTEDLGGCSVAPMRRMAWFGRLFWVCLLTVALYRRRSTGMT